MKVYDDISFANDTIKKNVVTTGARHMKTKKKL